MYLLQKLNALKTQANIYPSRLIKASTLNQSYVGLDGFLGELGMHFLMQELSLPTNTEAWEQDGRPFGLTLALDV